MDQGCILAYTNHTLLASYTIISKEEGGVIFLFPPIHVYAVSVNGSNGKQREALE